MHDPGRVAQINIRRRLGVLGVAELRLPCIDHLAGNTGSVIDADRALEFVGTYIKLHRVTVPG